MKKTLKGLAWGLGAAVVIIAVGIRNLVPAIKLVADMVIHGVDWAVKRVSDPAAHYFRGLRRLATLTFLPPLLVSVIALLLGWRTLVGWMGVWCFIWTMVLAHYAVPLALLIDLLAGKKKSGEPTGADAERGWLARRLKTYISFARQVLIYEAAAFITLNFVPIQNYWRGVPMFLLIVGLLIFSSYEWGTATGKWMKPFVRFSGFAAVGLLLICFFLPKLNFFAFLYKGGNIPTEGSPKGLEEVETKHVVGAIKTVSTWTMEHWIGAVIAVAVVFLIAYLVVKLLKQAKAPAGVAATATGGSGKGGSFVGMATMAATEAAARKLAALQQTAAVATRPAPTEEIWHGLVNPQKYPITLSTTISERIPRPAGFSTRMEPSGLPYELWANGVLLPKTPGVSTGIPIGTTYVQYRWTNPTPTNVVVGVGREVK